MKCPDSEILKSYAPDNFVLMHWYYSPLLEYIIFC